jgi:hypothetical protein
MSESIGALVARFERANRAVLDVVERGPTERFYAICPAERCTVAALACHIADVHALGADWVRKVLAGEPLPPVTLDTVDQVNAQQFARDAYRTKREALDRLRRSGAEATAVLEGLSDTDLGRSAPFALFGSPTISVRELVERILIADLESHLGSIRAAIER